jgi:hypothetical protein
MKIKRLIIVVFCLGLSVVNAQKDIVAMIKKHTFIKKCDSCFDNFVTPLMQDKSYGVTGVIQF